ncbi:transferase family-domain-containing protein [Roridomyces roridus]|uniref:Transferase family-domain-containing protein n=1 Tax=Roridomyces roridus TaxID=1738132 RepID=A0AAD7B6K4_9AGAR|nr:transferase family-domain-containing protein [Roridomyces roridus]
MAAPTPTTRIVRVKPQIVITSNRGVIQDSGDEIFQVSDTGHQIAPPMWIWLVDVFELPETENREQLTTNLIQGLERALGDHPELTGTMHCDTQTKRIVIKVPQGAATALHIKDAASQIPSYAWYHEHDYPVHRLEIAQLIPPEAVSMPIPIAPNLDTPGPVVAAFQVTFIEGGVIVGSAISHQVTDGLGSDAFLTTWAAYSKAAATGEPVCLGSDIPPHDLFTSEIKPSSHEWDALNGKYPTFRSNTAPPPPLSSGEVFKSRVFHVPRSKLAELKAECSVGLSAGEYISTWDAVVALWWRALLRARRPTLNLNVDEATTWATQAVNMRSRIKPGQTISSRFIGVSVALPRTEPLSVAQVLGARAEALPFVAQTVHTVAEQVTPTYIQGQLHWAAGSPDLRYNELMLPWVNGHDCAAVSWRELRPYTMHDFGFGLPTGFRWPQVARAGMKGRGVDEGLEVTFTVEERCFARLEKDEELLAYCEQRGLGL